MHDPHDARLLVSIVQERWDEAERLVRQRAPDSASFVALCVHADVPSWVHDSLTRHGRAELVGSEVLEGLERIRRKVQRDNLLLIAQAERSLDLLLEAGVVPVALKGLDLLHRVYPQFDVRTIDDVDLLVREEQLRAAIAALERGGWRLPPEPRRTHYIRSSHHLPLRSPGEIGVDFELHWNLAQEMRFRVDGPGLFERAVPLDVAGRRILRLDDQDLVAHLLLHHLTHYFDRRLKWAVDLRMIAGAPGFRWETVGRRIRAWNAVAACGMALVHLRKMVPDWIPAEALAELPVAGWRRLVTWPLRSSHPLELFRQTRRRSVRLVLAAVLLDNPGLLPRWLMHRAVRDRRPGRHPLEGEVTSARPSADERSPRTPEG